MTEAGNTTTTDYLTGGFQYSNSFLQFFPHAEGYVTNVLTSTDCPTCRFKPFYSLNYVFNYTDHLGNVRVSYAQESGALKILEENSYYPFGLKHTRTNINSKMFVQTNGTTSLQTIGELTPYTTYFKNNYKYNGKELQDELGLNMYDYGARNYDPAIGRWMNIDPLAEKYYPISPYNYVNNNPTRFIDPNGMEIDDSFVYRKDKKGNYVNPALVKAWEFFSNSKNGIKFLSQFAKKGQIIAGHKYEKSGKFDTKGINLNLGKLDEGDYANARTGHKITSTGLDLTIKVSDYSRTPLNEYIGNFGHEGIIHVQMFSEDYSDDKKLNYSNIDKDLVDWSNNLIKQGKYEKSWQTSLLQHTQEDRDKELDKKLVPILQHYYKSIGVKKTEAQIKRDVNGYAK